MKGPFTCGSNSDKFISISWSYSQSASADNNWSLTWRASSEIGFLESQVQGVQGQTDIK